MNSLETSFLKPMILVKYAYGHSQWGRLHNSYLHHNQVTQHTLMLLCIVYC